MKTRFPLAEAESVANHLIESLKTYTKKIIVAGSIRRRKPEVGDIELMYVPIITETIGTPGLLFNDGIRQEHNGVNHALSIMLAEEVLHYRPNVRGSVIWGPKNKLAIHVESGIPIDFFETTEAAWFNYLVCRTGGAENNKAIAMEANKRGWTWNPYAEGFTGIKGSVNEGRKSPRMESERQVYQFAGMPFLPPERRQ